MSLQENIDAAGGALALLRARSVDVGGVFPYPAEHTNWRDEQRAWATTAVLLDQSFHMSDLFISGPDTVRLLSDTSVNSYANLLQGVAKQYVAVNDEGQLVGDAIVIPAGRRRGQRRRLRARAELAGRSTARRAAMTSRSAAIPRAAASRGSKRLYRYELEGPAAAAILEAAADQPPEHIRFFHTGTVRIAGHEVQALNHTMGGVPGQEHSGVELFGPAEDEDDVIGAIVAAGAEHGLTRGGAKAYLSTLAESGWMGAVTPAIYTSESLREYREWLPARRWRTSRSRRPRGASSRTPWTATTRRPGTTATGT